MDERDDRPPRNRRRQQPPAPDSKPSWRVFLPYVVLGIVLAAAFIWIYFLGPQGANREPMLQDSGLRLEQPAATEATRFASRSALAATMQKS